MEQKHLISVAVFLLVLPLSAYATTFDVRDHGVKNGDITDALLKAWKLACNSSTPAKVYVGPGTWTLRQALLAGPNKSPIELQVQGTVKAPADPYQLPDKQKEWITINYLNYFTLFGGGVFDGQGKIAWTKNDCHKNKNCMKLPMNLSFNFINNSLIKDVTTKDSKNFHVNLMSSGNVTFQRFRISAPAESPNTDGLHIARSVGVKVIDSIIETGDDCISFGDELTDVLIKNVKCGPGHGISIGSLGRSTQEKDVSKVTIDNCTFVNTDNGVRIKTWPSAPATLKISDLKFTNLIMNNVSNPIIFDQQYCPWNLCSLDKPSLIQISKVKIENVRGTSFTQDVMIFSCSTSRPCQDVQIGNYDLKYIGDPTLGNATTKCQNVKYTFTGGRQNPPLCAASSAPKLRPK
ncbi:polygalacturonase-like [Salvia miltiorrhiza]|uniref:polygalacturonase-like n=1 Tax=Salvia miltiorrhiza TaxID=226208 RepID=UPI0025AD8643|nr:polygalacturonase-like [Salvia miltiorrhiza]